VNDRYRDDGMGDAVFSNPRKTNIEAYRDGLRLVREAAGKETFILGCCTPQNMRSYGGAIGLVDAMRIGPDNGAAWRSLLRGPTYGSRQYFLHGRVWYNDPDPVYVRTNLPLPQAQAICSWVALSGQLNLSSEWLPGLSGERLDLLKRTLPSHGLRPRPADLFEQEPPRVWLLEDQRRSPQRRVVGLFNWADQEAVFDYPLEQIGLDAKTEYVAFDYWKNTLVPSVTHRLQTRVTAQSCQVLAVRPRSDWPQLISTSRHITQGMVEVREETWDGRRRSLRGRSNVVAGDSYELRIVTGSRNTRWNVREVRLSSADQAAGVSASLQREDSLLRVTITSPANREVTWAVSFDRAPKQ
jgi:hypothetical protein